LQKPDATWSAIRVDVARSASPETTFGGNRDFLGTLQPTGSSALRQYALRGLLLTHTVRAERYISRMRQDIALTPRVATSSFQVIEVNRPWGSGDT
jgi:hypothetical protein